MLEVYGHTDDNLKNAIDCDCPSFSNKGPKESFSDSNINSQISSTSPLRETNSDSNLLRFSRQNSRTRLSSDIPGSPKTEIKTLNIQQNNFNMEIKVSSTENVRLEVEIGEQGNDENLNSDLENTKNNFGIRDESKKKFKQLGKLYSGKL